MAGTGEMHCTWRHAVRFAYKQDDQLVFDLPATDLRVRISAPTDAATAAALIPIKRPSAPVFPSRDSCFPLSEARRTRKGQYVFMNTRPVEDQLINRAIRDGYGGFPTGLHPALFLYMEVEPALVDVNVHPAKKEVRFRRSADVVNTIVEAIANTLQKHARQEIHAAAAPEPERTLPPAHSTTAPYGEIPARSTNPPVLLSRRPPDQLTSSAAQPPLSSSARQSHGPVPPPTLRAIPLKQVPATQGETGFSPSGG